MKRLTTNAVGHAGRTLRDSMHHWVAVVSLVGFGMMLGATMMPGSEALGEVRSPPPREAFLSGGQISVPLLKEISATLQQIDARLARMEAIAKQMRAENKAAEL